MQRVTVSEASTRLGISKDAVRARIKRRTLDSERDDDGNVFVVLPDDVADADQGDDQTPTRELVDELRDRVAFLERQLEHEQRAHGELRRLLAGALERIPELESSSETQRGPETPTEDEPKGEGRGVDERPQRGFWRRFFGVD